MLCKEYLKNLFLSHKEKDLYIYLYIFNFMKIYDIPFDYIAITIFAILIIIMALNIYTGKTYNYFIISNIHPKSIVYAGNYVYITYTYTVMAHFNRTIYGYKNLVYNLSLNANCSFVMFNDTLFDWGRCN